MILHWLNTRCQCHFLLPMTWERQSSAAVIGSTEQRRGGAQGRGGGGTWGSSAGAGRRTIDGSTPAPFARAQALRRCVIRAHGAWRTLAPLAPDSSRYLCFGLRATRTTEKVRPGHRFCSGDPRNPLFDPDLVACAQVRGAGGYERRRGARREARRATCSWSRRAAGRTPQPTSGATRVTGGGQLGLGLMRRWIGRQSRGHSHDSPSKPSSSARTTRARTLVALGHLRDAGSPRCAYLRRQRGGS
jgi:hypothetical protein